MVGIDVGAAKVTLSNRTAVLLHDEVPGDLLKRIADDRPFLRITESGCELVAPHKIYAAAVGDALRHQHLGGPEASRVAVAVPGWWSPRAVARVQASLDAQHLNSVTVNDAEATVAEHLASSSALPNTVAVVSVRKTQSSVTIVQECNARPVALPSPVLVIEEGGDTLDSAVLRHLVQSLTDIDNVIDQADPLTISAATLTLPQCRQLRESLSASATESIRLHLPGVTHSVRFVRSELEEVARPWADEIVRMVVSALNLHDGQVDAILLTGGLAKMPLVSQKLSAALSLEVFVPEAPLLAAARGADRLLSSLPRPRRDWTLHRLMHLSLGTRRRIPPPFAHTAAPATSDTAIVDTAALDSAHTEEVPVSEADAFFAAAFAGIETPPHVEIPKRPISTEASS